MQTSTSQGMKKLKAASKFIVLNGAARAKLLREQLAKLAELQAELLAKLQSKKVKDSLLELRKYRRPPRAAAQVITALMVLINEPSCLEWRAQALDGLTFPDHNNHIAQIWVSMTPLLQPNLLDKLKEFKSTEMSQEMDDRIKACQLLLEGVCTILHDISKLCSACVLFRIWSCVTEMFGLKCIMYPMSLICRYELC